MTLIRRIAVAALVAAFGFGFIGAISSPASAKDTTWGEVSAPGH